MTTLIASAADEPNEPGQVALSHELPLDKLEHDLKRPIPAVRGVNEQCIKAAAAGDVPNPESFVEESHRTQYDKDASGDLAATRRVLGLLVDYGSRASARVKALVIELKNLNRYEKVPSDARAWTGFERFRAVFLGVLSLTLLGASMQQLAQLLVSGGYTATLVEGLRFAFVPLVAVAALEIIGQKLIVGERTQRNYARVLAGVCVVAALVWSHGFISQYSGMLGEGSEVNLDLLLGDPSAEAALPPIDGGGEGRGSSTLLASIIAEICGAALIWVVLFKEFDEHAPWRRCLSRDFKDASGELAALSQAQVAAALIEGAYQVRVNALENGREELVKQALTAFHRERGDRRHRTTDVIHRRTEDLSPPPSPPSSPRFDRNRLPDNSSTNGQHHED